MLRSLTRKMLLAMTLFIILLIVIGSNAYLGVLSSNQAVQHLATAMLPRIDDSIHFNIALVRAVAEAQSFSFTDQENERAEALTALSEARTALDKMDDEIAQNLSNTGPQTTPYTQLQQERRDLLDAVDQRVRALLDATATGDQDAITAAFEQTELMESKILEIEQKTGTVIGSDVDQVTGKLITSNQSALVILPISLGLIAAFVVLGLWLVGRLIIRPIKNLANLAERIGAGELDVTIPITNNDEIGDLQRVLSHMVANLRDQRTALETRNAELQNSVETQNRLLETVQQLSTPLLPLMDGIVVLPIVGHVDSERAGAILQTLLDGVTQWRARVAILDVTGIALLDTHVMRLLLDAIGAARLLGAEVVLAGISAAMAQIIATQGIELGSLRTSRNLSAAIVIAQGLEAKQQQSNGHPFGRTR